jgi:hypothetical protein
MKKLEKLATPMAKMKLVISAIVGYMMVVGICACSSDTPIERYIDVPSSDEGSTAAKDTVFDDQFPFKVWRDGDTIRVVDVSTIKPLPASKVLPLLLNKGWKMETVFHYNHDSNTLMEFPALPVVGGSSYVNFFFDENNTHYYLSEDPCDPFIDPNIYDNHYSVPFEYDEKTGTINNVWHVLGYKIIYLDDSCLWFASTTIKDGVVEFGTFVKHVLVDQSVVDEWNATYTLQ